MDITHTTIPGSGVVHHCDTRRGQRFAVMEDHAGRRTLLVYDPADPDEPAQQIAMDPDEADQVADLLHTQPVLDRLAALERRLAGVPGTAL